MKKRFLAILLTLVMALALAAPALAVELKTGDTEFVSGDFKLTVTADSVGAVATYKMPTYGWNENDEWVQTGFISVPVYDVKPDVKVTFTGAEGAWYIWGRCSATVEDGVLIADWESGLGSDLSGEYPLEVSFSAEAPEGLIWLYEFSQEALAGTKYVALRLNSQAAATGTYTAKKYDTWGQIALNNYGTYAVWPQLMKANGNKAVKADMVITLPEKLGSYSLLPAQVLAEGEKTYTVKAGDTLAKIAAAAGTGITARDIFERNSDRLVNVNTIYEAQVIVIPVKAEEPAEAEAPAEPAEPETPAEELAEEQPVSIAKGDKVTVREGAKTYTGGNLASFVYKKTYTVIEVKGDRVVIGINGAVTAAVNAADLVPAEAAAPAGDVG